MFKTASRVLYADPGYLIFVREQTLVAQKVDAGTLGHARRAAADRAKGWGSIRSASRRSTVSQNGVLIYRAGELERRRLLWMDRDGKESDAFDEPGDYRTSRSRPTARGLPSR